MTDENLVVSIKLWVEKFVIGLNLCPFARHPFQKSQIRFAVSNEEGIENQATNFWKEIILLEKEGSDKISNSLIILPTGFEDFEEYLLLIEICEDLLEMQGKSANFQIASFHPDYQFAETEMEDPRNFTNRSPFPLIHILRSEEVELAIKHHPNTLEIPEINEQKMEELGTEKLKKMMAAFMVL